MVRFGTVGGTYVAAPAGISAEWVYSASPAIRSRSRPAASSRWATTDAVSASIAARRLATRPSSAVRRRTVKWK